MVMSIILMVLGFAAPSLVGVLKGKKVEQALSSVAATLEQARLDATTQNTYIWAGFLNVLASESASGQDELWMMSFRGASGEKRVQPESSGKMLPLTVVQKVEGVGMVPLDKLPDLLKNRLPAPVVDMAEAKPSTQALVWKGAGSAGSLSKDGSKEFVRLVLFTPRGEALWETGEGAALPLPQPYFAMALSRTQRGSVADGEKDMGVVTLAGVTGRVSVERP